MLNVKKIGVAIVFGIALASAASAGTGALNALEIASNTTPLGLTFSEKAEIRAANDSTELKELAKLLAPGRTADQVKAIIAALINVDGGQKDDIIDGAYVSVSESVKLAIQNAYPTARRFAGAGGGSTRGSGSTDGTGGPSNNGGDTNEVFSPS